MRTVGIGVQNFGKLLESEGFYIDKTKFLKEWWEGKDEVTLITRPRRFGKTLTMSMVEWFFSAQYAGQKGIFEGLEVWKDKEFRRLQGSYPVISLSFSDVKERDYDTAVYRICDILQELYQNYHFVLGSDCFSDGEKAFFEKMEYDMLERDISVSLKKLSKYLYCYYGRKVIILLDEYDTPTQEAYLGGYWEELAQCFQRLFHSTFKANSYLERGLITGITRISKESVFSDLNNLKVVTMTSDKYADIFGFTKQEVFAAMDEMGLSDRETVEKWYDGYVIGKVKGIYNPWSIINYLDEKKINTYWTNTSSNSLVNRLLREGSSEVKKNMESLLQEESITVPIDEEIVFSQLDEDEDAVWSLLLASGYLKVINVSRAGYELKLVNYEVLQMFQKLVHRWFGREKAAYTGFIGTLLSGNVEEMNEYLNEISENIFSYFDTQQREPEKFYHGFILGLLVDLGNDYILTSNRESGKGRYDIVIEPKDRGKETFIIEFKVVKPNQAMKNAVEAALLQIEEKQYEQDLLVRGFSKGKIKKYGFAFKGKTVLIGGAE